MTDTAEAMANGVAFWEAVNRYVVTCGGDPSKRVYGNTERATAVVEIEALRLHESQKQGMVLVDEKRAWELMRMHVCLGCRKSDYREYKGKYGTIECRCSKRDRAEAHLQRKGKSDE